MLKSKAIKRTQLMFVRLLIIAGVIGGVLLGGTALATDDHYKDKEKDFKPCKLEVTDSPRIRNKHCKPSPTPVITPKVTPTPSATPKATPTSVSPKPSVTPAATPAVVPGTKSASQPAVLPSVGGTGKKRP
jgi:cell division septation protein DedD